MRDILKCFAAEESGCEPILYYDEEDDSWGEGCCEDELMDDDFYERGESDED